MLHCVNTFKKITDGGIIIVLLLSCMNDKMFSVYQLYKVGMTVYGDLECPAMAK